MAAEVLFYAPKNAKLTIGADEIQEEVRTADGRILKQSANISFNEHFFRTDDAKAIKAVRKSLSYAQGMVREVKDDAEYHQLLSQIAAKRLTGADRPADVKLPAQEIQGYTKTEGTPNDVASMV